MRYSVSMAPGVGAYVFDVESLSNGTIRMRHDGRPVDLDVVAVGGALSVRVGAKIVDLTTEGKLPDLGVIASGRRFHARVMSDRMVAGVRLEKAGQNQAETVVKSPMPGRVVKVLVRDGDPVRAGQGLVVLEAMKMENEIRSRCAGTVRQVHVVAGITVDARAPLVTLV